MKERGNRKKIMVKRKGEKKQLGEKIKNKTGRGVRKRKRDREGKNGIGSKREK